MITHTYSWWRICLFSLYLTWLQSYHAFEVVRFTGGGIYFWWQAGAATYLLENTDLQETQLIGSSAGSISASLVLAKADFQQAAKLAISQVEKLQLWDNPIGLAGIWGSILQEFLEELILPANITTRDLHRVHIAATPRFIFRGTTYLHNFENKVELISAVLTSTHIPFFMNGKPWKAFKGKKYIDGSFWPFLLRTKPNLPNSIINKQPISDGYQRAGLLNKPVSLHRTVLLTENKERHEDPTTRYLKLLDLDYQHDQTLLKTMKGVAFVKLIKPETLYDMMDLGYKFMKSRKYESTSLSLIPR